MSPTSSATRTSTPLATPPPAEACAPAPRSQCQQGRRASGINLNAAYRNVRAKWRGAAPMALSDFGNPMTGATAYHLCIYDTGVGSPTLAFSATVPAGGMCGTRPCWTQRRNSLRYTNTAATPDGIRHMTLAAGGSANASIALSGRGQHLRMPVAANSVFLLRAFPEVIMQVQRSDAADCWEAVFKRPWTYANRTAFADLIR